MAIELCFFCVVDYIVGYHINEMSDVWLLCVKQVDKCVIGAKELVLDVFCKFDFVKLKNDGRFGCSVAIM